MNTKLLLSVLFTLLFISGNAQSQSQIWSLTHNGGVYGLGAILKANKDGSDAKVVYSFRQPRGYHPYGDLLQASDGNIYGTCFDGGAYLSCTIFMYKPSTGTYTDVYDFDIIGGDYPRSGMIEGPNGKLYGAVSGGGFNGGGVIYSYDMFTSTYTDLYNFLSPTGKFPIGNPILYNNILYGTTQYGGANNNGVIYRYDFTSGNYTPVYEFDGLSGSGPEVSLMEASNGKFYGVTTNGGLNGKGVIFCYDPASGIYTKLHDFDGANGGFPKGKLMQSANGRLYGMTTEGGAFNFGIIFSYDIAANAMTNLYSFNGTDGKTPVGSLNQAGNLLVGTTNEGGSNNLGVVFNYDLSANVYTKTLDFNGINGASPNGGFISVASTGLSPHAVADDGIILFPNPVIDFVNVIYQDQPQQSVTFTLSDLAGKIILSHHVMLNGRDPEVLNMSGLSQGTYLLEIKSEKRTVVKKVVKN